MRYAFIHQDDEGFWVVHLLDTEEEREPECPLAKAVTDTLGGGEIWSSRFMYLQDALNYIDMEFNVRDYIIFKVEPKPPN